MEDDALGKFKALNSLSKGSLFTCNILSILVLTDWGVPGHNTLKEKRLRPLSV